MGGATTNQDFGLNLDEEDGTSMDQRLIYGSCFRHLFAVVVCDERNKVKNPNSQLHLAVAKLFDPIAWIQPTGHNRPQ